MTRRFYLGFASGLALAFNARVTLFFMGDTPYGVYPFLLVILLLVGIAAVRSGKREWSYGALLPLSLIAAAPIFLFLVDLATTHFLFLSGRENIGELFLRILVLLILYGPAILSLGNVLESALHTEKIPRRKERWIIPVALTGGIAGLIVEFSTAGVSPLMVGFPVYLATLAGFWLLLARPAKKEAAQTRAVKKTRDNKISKTDSTISTPSRSAFLVIAGTLVLSGAVLYWFFTWSLRIRSSIAHPPDFHSLYLLVLSVAALTAGWIAVSLTGKKRYDVPGFFPLLLLIAVYALLMQGLIILWSETSHARLFIDYQAGITGASQIHVPPLLFLSLPSIAAGMLFALLHRIPVQATRMIRGLSSVAGGIAATVLFILIPVPEFPVLVTLLCALFLVLGLVFLIAGREIWSRSAVPIAALAALLLWTIFSPVPEKASLVDTNRFTRVHEIRSPEGIYSLIRFRNYDDPFYAILYNQTNILSQTSAQFRSLYARMGLLPMIIQGTPRSVLALGTGSTLPLNTIAHTGAELDIVEESPALILLADSIASNITRSFRGERTRFFCQPILPFLASEGRRYDLIIRTEPFAERHVTLADFSTPLFAAARERLTPRGIFAQWLPLGRLESEDLLAVIRTMADVFPHLTLWYGDTSPGNGMICLAGSNAPQTIDDSFYRRFSTDADVEMDLRVSGLPGLPDLFSWYGMNTGDLDLLTADAARIDRFNIARPPPQGNDKTMEYAVAALRLLLQRRNLDTSMWSVPDSVVRKIRLTFRDEPTLLAAQSFIAAERRDTARTLLYDLLGKNPSNTRARFLLAELLTYEGALKVQQQEFPGARVLLEEAVRLGGMTSYLSRLLMITCYATGDKEAANVYINQGLNLDRKNAGLFDNAATLFANSGMFRDAEKNYNRALTVNPHDVDIYCNAASSLYNDKQEWEAVRLLDKAVALCPNPSRAYYLQGIFYNDMKRPREAAVAMKHFLETAMPNDSRLPDAEKFVEEATKTMGSL